MTVICLLIISLIGCDTEGNINIEDGVTYYKITIQKRVGEDNTFESMGNISKDVTAEIVTLLESANWEENMQVDMSIPPQYKLTVNKEDSADQYLIWISPNKELLELIVPNEGRYVQLDKADSALLYKQITNEDLSDFN